VIRLTRLTLDPELGGEHALRVAQLHACLDFDAPVPQVVLDAYKAVGLKTHLRSESSDKCAYCESKITHVYWGDVEHIKPKGLFPRNRLDVGNLCLACAKCNNLKLDYWSDELPLVNPFVDDPQDELVAFGAFVARRPGCDRARMTVSLLGLNRPELLERRQERWQLLQPLADQYMQAPDGPVRDLLRQELVEQAGKDREFTMIVREYLRIACGIGFDDVPQSAPAT
jgi:hypothetical protein